MYILMETCESLIVTTAVQCMVIANSHALQTEYQIDSWPA